VLTSKVNSRIYGSFQLHHENISSAVHGCPADAVDIHLDVRSRNSIGASLETPIS
jgi:hypothetical protein